MANGLVNKVYWLKMLGLNVVLMTSDDSSSCLTIVTSSMLWLMITCRVPNQVDKISGLGSTRHVQTSVKDILPNNSHLYRAGTSHRRVALCELRATSSSPLPSWQASPPIRAPARGEAKVCCQWRSPVHHSWRSWSVDVETGVGQC